jgi:hypothetical protein
MRIDSLKKPQSNPHINRHEVQIPRQITIKQRPPNRPKSKNKNLSGMRILSGEAERCGVLVMELMYVLVHWTPVEEFVSEVVPDVFHYEEAEDLGDECAPGGEGDVVGLHAEEFCDGVEDPYLFESI